MGKSKAKRKVVRNAVRDIAAAVARRLFTDGSGNRAERLVMDYSGAAGGIGWSECEAADQIEKVLKSQRGSK